MGQRIIDTISKHWSSCDIEKQKKLIQHYRVFHEESIEEISWLQFLAYMFDLDMVEH